jgi:hypothetical protein
VLRSSDSVSAIIIFNMEVRLAKLLRM